MQIYERLLTRNKNILDDDNVESSQKCSAIIPIRLLTIVKDPCSFILTCTIGKLSVENAICDSGYNINLMILSMKKQLDCKDFISTSIILILSYPQIYPTFKHPNT